MSQHIHPIFDRTISREEREERLGQKGRVYWFTGLSGSGKSTLALALERHWFDSGKHVYLLDGDNIRSGLNNNLGFSQSDRFENIRRIAEVAKLLKEAGWWVLCSFVSPTNEIREVVKKVIGEDDLQMIWVNTSLEECERRDVKGLYAKARAGEIPNFTGISAPFEVPIGSHIEIKTEGQRIEESLEILIKKITID